MLMYSTLENEIKLQNMLTSLWKEPDLFIAKYVCHQNAAVFYSSCTMVCNIPYGLQFQS